jgi:hypothetical protein
MKKLAAVLFGIMLSGCAVAEAAETDRPSRAGDDNQLYTGTPAPSSKNPANSDNSDYLDETDH